MHKRQHNDIIDRPINLICEASSFVDLSKSVITEDGIYIINCLQEETFVIVALGTRHRHVVFEIFIQERCEEPSIVRSIKMKSEKPQYHLGIAHSCIDVLNASNSL